MTQISDFDALPPQEKAKWIEWLVAQELFRRQCIAGAEWFRGGTAIHKLLFEQPLRYSEDIGLTQTRAEPIGATVDAIRPTVAQEGP